MGSEQNLAASFTENAISGLVHPDSSKYSKLQTANWYMEVSAVSDSSVVLRSFDPEYTGVLVGLQFSVRNLLRTAWVHAG